MCGLVGVAGKIENDQRKAFHQLLLFDVVRGVDSTGMAAVSKDNQKQVDILKKAVHSYDFQCLPMYKKILDWDSRVIIGHNRAATKGRVNHRNSHPFWHGSVVGVHNGTLKTCYDLPDHTKFAIDSENLIYSLDKIGAKETYSKLNGAAALVWWDTDLATLSMLKNDDRPLSYAFSEDMKTLYWASEDTMLEFVLKRLNLKHKAIVNLTNHTLYTFHVDGKEEELDKPKAVKLDPYQAPPLRRTYHGSGGATHGANGGGNKVIGFKRNEKPKEPEKIGGYGKGDRISFYPIQRSKRHYECLTPDNIDVRVFINGYDDFVETMFDKDLSGMYSGVVAAISGNGDHLVIKKSTIKPFRDSFIYEDESYFTEALYPVHNMNWVCERDFLEATKHGCAQCSDPGDVDEAFDYLWTDSQTFYCLHCQKDLEDFGVLH